MIKVFSAKKILTMDVNKPTATHVAVKNGRILSVGDSDCAKGWGEFLIDNRFKNKVIMPGFIEAHAHVSAGGVWRYTYCGHYSRIDPNGVVHDGVKNYEDLISRLRVKVNKTSIGQPIVGWGFDPNFLEGRRLDRLHLDQVSINHTVVVLHSNFHVLSANTKALSEANLLKNSNIEGVVMDSNSMATGELQEFAAMDPVMKEASVRFKDLSDEIALENYGKIAQNCGVTTVADLLSDLDESELTMIEKVTARDTFPVRYVPIMNAMKDLPEKEAARAITLSKRSTEKLHLGRAKLFTDGSIQGLTAKLKEPGYFKGTNNGIWNMQIDHFKAAVKALHIAGVKTHIHCNGDLASELALEAYGEAILKTPNPDLRHTLEHVQLADIDQFRRMRSLGLTVNVFANHLHYFGDVHWAQTLGPNRAERMDACSDAAEIFEGNFAIHSDAPVTPMAPLNTAWCAVNRQTATGRILGDSQKISVEQALYAITMGAAYVLKMEDEIGSIKCGKWADFTVLDKDPMSVKPLSLKDVPIHCTVLGGEINKRPKSE